MNYKQHRKMAFFEAINKGKPSHSFIKDMEKTTIEMLFHLSDYGNSQQIRTSSQRLLQDIEEELNSRGLMDVLYFEDDFNNQRRMKNVL
jgi:hypothetical protein